jgi:hypothetical protein
MEANCYCLFVWLTVWAGNGDSALFRKVGLDLSDCTASHDICENLIPQVTFTLRRQII